MRETRLILLSIVSVLGVRIQFPDLISLSKIAIRRRDAELHKTAKFIKHASRKETRWTPKNKHHILRGSLFNRRYLSQARSPPSEIKDSALKSEREEFWECARE